MSPQPQGSDQSERLCETVKQMKQHSKSKPLIVNPRLCCLASSLLFLIASGCASNEPGDDETGGQSGACMPDARECLNDLNFRVCRPDGGGYDYGTCPAEMPCQGGLCGGNAVEPTQDAGTSNSQNTSDGGGQNVSNGQDTGSQNPNNGQDTGGQNGNNGQDSGGNDLDQPCTPGERSCIDSNTLRLCRPDGNGFEIGTCNQDNPCQDGICGGSNGTPGTCIGDTRECLDNTTLRVCFSDGTAWDNIPCPGNQFCQDAICRPLQDCTDMDGDGYGVGSDCLGADCRDDAYIINPSGWEVCGNGEDEDCDGQDAPCDCDPVRQDCPGDNLRCTLRSNGGDFEFACAGGGLLGEGEPCGGIPDNCERGLVCIQAGDAQESVCTRMCDPGAGTGCLGDAVCGASLSGFNGVGLCIGLTRCDPVDNPGVCPADTHCEPYSNREAACFPGGGGLGENASCNPGNSQCGPGLTCVTTSDMGSVCKAFCKVTRGNGDCASRQGRACQPIEFSFTLLGRTNVIQTYGICN